MVYVASLSVVYITFIACLCKQRRW